MDRGRITLAVLLAVGFFGIGSLVLLPWPWLQQNVAPLLPRWWLEPVTSHIAYWGVYATVGLMMLRVLPSYHRVRIIGDLIGLLAFLVNLLFQENYGNVPLETALILLTGFSVIYNRKHHEPCTADGIQWAKALGMLASCYLLGWLLGEVWPVDSETELQGWGWAASAWAGAMVLYISVVCLETRILRSEQWQYPVIYGIGCVLLTLSYLGQYNYAGLTLNASLACLTYAPWGWRLCKWIWSLLWRPKTTALAEEYPV